MPDYATPSEVLQVAIELWGNETQARRWFECEPLPEFKGLTAYQAVQQGRAQDVIRLLHFYEAGFLG